MSTLKNIRIGTIVPGANAPEYIKQIIDYGFESFALGFPTNTTEINFKKIADGVKKVIGDKDIVINALGVYGNPLESRPEDEQTRKSWKKLIDNAHLFGASVICGFAGRLIDKPLDASIPRFKKVFTPIAQHAADKGLKIAFENCEMGGNWKLGDWNMAQTPEIWDMMFDAVPFDNVGLEWEPCHQMVKLIDPMPQLKKYVSKIFHLHGKDATIHWDVIKEHGVFGSKQFAYHRTPGFGDSNWTDIITELRRGGFTGSIDIEGWHDPVYRKDLEMTGQVYALNYLKNCRGGFDYIPNPKVSW